MGKIGLVIAREYLTRVKKRSFLIMTFLTPLLFGGMITLIVWLSATQKDDSEKQIMVIDETFTYQDALHNTETVKFIPLDLPIDIAKEQIGGHYALLYIYGDLKTDPDKIEIFSTNQVHYEVQREIKDQLREFIKQQKIAGYPDIDLEKILKDLETNINLPVIKIGNDGSEKKSAFELSMAIGYVVAFLIYITIFIYGAQVMRGVMEEKTGRIVEIIVSSLKPFELMMGKIVGLALVGLTQFLMWIILSSLVWLLISVTLLAPDVETVSAAADANTISQVTEMLGSINFVEIAVYFIIFFLGGYFLYAALFAAVGAAVDNESDTQQFVFPITIPLIFALYLGMSVINNPHGPVAMWCSFIPFTSPIVMMVRIPFDVPLWQKLLSIVILALSFVLTTMAAAKIYRTGILMYGKKVNFKELIKWLSR